MCLFGCLKRSTITACGEWNVIVKNVLMPTFVGTKLLIRQYIVFNVHFGQYFASSGGVFCPACARHAIFISIIPALTQTQWTANILSKAHCISPNNGIQHQCVRIMLLLSMTTESINFGCNQWKHVPHLNETCVNRLAKSWNGTK